MWATPVVTPPAPDESLLATDPKAAPALEERGPRLEREDVALGLSYVDAYTVLVVTDDVPPAALPAAVEAALFTGARLVVLIGPGRPAPAVVPADATVLAAPDVADDGEFATLVGGYAAALDGGMRPAEAFAAATRAAGWEALDRLA